MKTHVRNVTSGLKNDGSNSTWANRAVTVCTSTRSLNNVYDVFLIESLDSLAAKAYTNKVSICLRDVNSIPVVGVRNNTPNKPYFVENHS